MNLILLNKIKIKKIYWNNKNKNFIKNKKFFFDIKPYGNYYLFENNININSKKKINIYVCKFYNKINNCKSIALNYKLLEFGDQVIRPN